jgi:hypothetical protein
MNAMKRTLPSDRCSSAPKRERGSVPLIFWVWLAGGPLVLLGWLAHVLH